MDKAASKTTREHETNPDHYAFSLSIKNEGSCKDKEISPLIIITLYITLHEYRNHVPSWVHVGI